MTPTQGMSNRGGNVSPVHHMGSEQSPPDLLGGSRARARQAGRLSAISSPISPKPVWVAANVAYQPVHPPCFLLGPIARPPSTPPYTDRKRS